MISKITVAEMCVLKLQIFENLSELSIIIVVVGPKLGHEYYCVDTLATFRCTDYRCNCDSLRPRNILTRFK